MNCLAIFDPKYWRGPSFPLFRVVMNPPSVRGGATAEKKYVVASAWVVFPGARITPPK